MKNMKKDLSQEINAFFCEKCNYKTINKKDFKKHEMTAKHARNAGSEIFLSQKSQNQPQCQDEPQKIKYKCNICDSLFNSSSSAWRHKKKCIDKPKQDNNEVEYKELLMIALKENKEMREFMFKQHETIEKQQSTINEIIPKIGNNTINSNNSFNLNFFLNEQCKDAITMDEFMSKIQVSLSDLLYTKEKGIAEGLSNIFIENMSKLPLTQRPIHCTDIKRETIYIKNEKWEKDEDKTQTKQAIKKLSNIQIKNLSKFKEEYPDCMKIDDQKDTYMELIKAATDDVSDKEDKILKNVCKKVYLKNDLIQQ
jgi:hypothetical protein